MDLSQNFWKKAWKMREKIFFPHILLFDVACKNQREISSNKVGRLLWPLRGEISGKREGILKGEGEMQYRVHYSVYRLKVGDFRHPTYGTCIR